MLSLIAALVLANPIGSDCPAEPDAGFYGTVTLGQGSQKVLRAPFVGEPRFVAPQNVAEFKSLGNDQLLIIGVGPGQGELQLGARDGGVLRYGIRVRRMDVCGMVPVEVKELFPCGSTLDVKMVGDRFILDGLASSVAEWKAARVAVERFKGAVVVLGKLDPAVLEKTLRDANTDLSRSGLGRLRFSVVGDQPMLEGDFVEGDGARVEALRARWMPELDAATWKPPR